MPWRSVAGPAHAQRLGKLIWIDVPSYKAGRPTKVIIAPVAGARRDRIRLLGQRCSDSTPLRFGFFGEGPGSSTPENVVARSHLALKGAGSLPLGLRPMLRHGWRESGARSGWTRTIASVVFEVP